MRALPGIEHLEEQLVELEVDIERALTDASAKVSRYFEMQAASSSAGGRIDYLGWTPPLLRAVQPTVGGGGATALGPSACKGSIYLRNPAANDGLRCNAVRDREMAKGNKEVEIGATLPAIVHPGSTAKTTVEPVHQR